MFKADVVNGKPAVVLYGESVDEEFNYLAEAQEFADKLNRDYGYEEENQN